jgi:ELWxxDGT repeat protein
VKEIWPGPGAGLSVFFGTFAPPVALDGRLFFFASHPELGWEPWISDGTEPGTNVVRDIYSTPSSQAPFFNIDSSFPIDADGRLYFVGSTWESLQQPWTSRGTPQSTHQVTETTTDGSLPAFAWPIAPLGTRLIYLARAQLQEEIWITSENGDEASLLSVVEWSGGFGTSFDGRAFFDVSEGRATHLWVSDGSPGGTGRLVEEPTFFGGWPSPFAELDDRLYFVAGSGDELWATDGTTEGTARVRELTSGPASSHVSLIAASSDRIFFTIGLPDTGEELWTSDGTEGGTQPLPEVRPGPESGFRNRSIQGNPTNFTLAPVPGGVAFVGDDGVRGEEPWWSDGVGVDAIGDLRPGARGSEPRWLTSTGDTLFFAADDGMHGRELWRWRPGEAAALVADLVPGPGSSLPQELAGVDGLLYFSAYTPETGVELWRSDGTAAGTVMLQDIWPGEESSTPSRLTASGRYLFFTADDGTHGREMWSLLLPTRRPRAFLTASGGLVPGGEVVLTLRLENPPPEELPDGSGHELYLSLPAVLEPLGVTATSGKAELVVADESFPGAALRSAAAAATGWAVTWNGSLPPGSAVEVTIVARVAAATSTGIALQAVGAFDSDGDGTNDQPFVSDDPSRPGADDATLLPLAIEIPALGPSGLALLAAALALFALLRLRRAAV